MERISNFIQLVEAAKRQGVAKVAVIGPHDEATVMAAKEGIESGLATFEFFGDQKKIEPLLDQVGLDKTTISLQYKANTAEFVQAAVQSVREGRNQVLMKGTVDTSVILRAVLDKNTGLNMGRLCSHLIACEISSFDRLLIITDGGLNICPTLQEKVDIIKNAIDLAHVLGIDRPKVGVLAAVEKVSLQMPVTMDAAILAKMSESGEFGNAVVDGPFAFDNAISEKSAKLKGIKSEVAGNVDVILVPTIEVGNALGKAIGYLAKSSNAGIVLGSKAPIVLPSRAGKPEAKWASLALGALLGRR